MNNRLYLQFIISSGKGIDSYCYGKNNHTATIPAKQLEYFTISEYLNILH